MQDQIKEKRLNRETSTSRFFHTLLTERDPMFKHSSFFKKAFYIAFTTIFLLSGLYASEILLRLNSEDYQKTSLQIRKELEILGEEEGIILTRADASVGQMLIADGVGFEVIRPNDYSNDDLSPVPGGGIPLGVVVRRGNQGIAGWHEGVAMAGDVLAYMETHVGGQLPGFTFWDMKKDSTWHHYIDTDLNGDEPLFMAASDHHIFYTFHYWGATNSAMRYYCYNTETGIETEIENFGYGFEGFGVSDTWVMRVGNKGMAGGWNNQIYAHNIITGNRFELVADSTQQNWGGYNYDSYGGPKTDGNTIVFTYTDATTWTDVLKVYSLGADGVHGTTDDTGGTLSSTGMSYGQYRVDGQYIVWVERTASDEGNIRAYDMGEDALYGTSDDVGVFDVCLDAGKQSTVRIDNNVIVWEDWRNVASTAGNGEHDIYGYNLATDTEFRSTANPDSMIMADIVGNEVILVKHDWDESESYNDIYLMNITGRIESDYYWIDVTLDVPPMAHSLISGNAQTSPFSFSNIIMAAKGPLSALFISDGVGNEVALSYSAVTGEWNTDVLTASADDYTLFVEGDNGLILGKTATAYLAYTFNGNSGTFSAKDMNISKPSGFATGKNISLVWGDDAKSYWVRTYDADLNTWSGFNGTCNDPWRVIATAFSDSLALLLHAEGDTLCNHTQVKVYDLALHKWVFMQAGIGRLNEINIHEWEQTIQMKANDHFAVITQEYNSYYNDFIYTYGTGEDAWKVKATLSGYTYDKPILGENFIVQGARSGNIWLGHIFNAFTGEWLPEYIESQKGIDGLETYEDMMLAWQENEPFNATLWAYSTQADGLQKLSITYPGDLFTVKVGAKMAFVIASSGFYTTNDLYVFNGIKGEWKEPLEVYNTAQFMMDVTGHTGIFLHWYGSQNGINLWKAFGYSAFKDEWDIFEFKSNNIEGIFTSDFCGLIPYEDWYYTQNKHFQVFNAVDGEWTQDQLTVYANNWNGLSMNDRILLITEKGAMGSSRPKAHMFSPILNLWSSTDFSNSYELEGYYSTPTSVFAWDGHEFKIIFSTQNTWDTKPGNVDDIHVTDYAIAVTMTNYSQTTTHYFYPPKTEIINDFEISEGPLVNIKSSWAAEVTWKTNMNSDTRLVWAVNGYYGIIEQDTLPEQYTKDHRILIEGLEANTTYYYGAVSIIADTDTAHSDTLTFSTGADSSPPSLVGIPQAYRIHDNEASVWWETDEPSTAILRWGLTTAYTDTLSYNESTYITNALRMYDLIKDTTYHYQVGGYDRYGNGPFFSGDYTFRTSNPLPVVTDLVEADSTLWGAAYMTWEPPRLDSAITKETFNSGIPVDWKVYNLGDNKKGTTWRSGYSGNNPVAYCSYGEEGEKQEEWLISNPITIDGTTGGVLNFWHMGFYTDYDNAPNKVMISWTGTDRSDFSTIWSSQNLPTDWSLVQINLNYTSNYGKTFYLAFVYESTYGEIWMLDNIYMDYDIDGYYEDFNDLTGWTNQGGRWGLKGEYNNYSLGVDGIKESSALPDPITTWDAWQISPNLKITKSHHILGFWQMGWAGEYDTKPNEVRVVFGDYSIETNSQVVRSVYPVPNGWQWVTVDLSAYIGQTLKIAYRYHSDIGWWWNGSEWIAYWGEDWYIDDMYLFENAPAMVKDPNALPNEKPMKFASSPKGQRISNDGFTAMNTVIPKEDLLASEAPIEKANLPKDKPLISIQLPKVTAEPAPSKLVEVLPVLLGYEVYGRFVDQQYYTYKGYVTSPSFVGWDTYLGNECEYYVEAVYDQGNAQPSNKAIIKGGTKYAKNEYGYDTGRLYYSYWWYPGMGFANDFDFYGEDSALVLEKVKVHIAHPGSFKIQITALESDYYYDAFTSNTINVTQEGWHTIDLPEAALMKECVVEFQPQDTLVELSYDDFDCGHSWLSQGDNWTASNVTFFIRLVGEKYHWVSVTDIPAEFKLSQNYPNPFNPVTNIEFELPEAEELSLKVYDIRGSLVATLADGHRDAGKYQVVWNAKNMKGAPVASGIYLLKMTAGEFTATKKMTLLR